MKNKGKERMKKESKLDSHGRLDGHVREKEERAKSKRELFDEANEYLIRGAILH